MGGINVAGVRLAGIASAVPAAIRTLAEDALIFGEAEVLKISESTGVKQRHIAPEGMCASDLCFAAADRLLDESGWARDSIDTLIFISQTPDYILPATACTLQARLGLSKNCAAFDVNLGCSGYIYGLWLASSLIAGGGSKRVLLLTGELGNFYVSPRDRSASLLFGDAGTATLVEKGEGSAPWNFVLGTDGTGSENLIISNGATRNKRTPESSIRTERESNNVRSDEDLFMDGAEIFTFTLREVPKLIKSVLAQSEMTVEDIDSFVFHQANKFMLEYLAKRMKVPLEKVPIILESFGNTSSASIPLALSAALSGKLRKEKAKLVLAGFGVGYSWGAVSLECGEMIMPEIIYVTENPAGISATGDNT